MARGHKLEVRVKGDGLTARDAARSYVAAR